MAGGRNVSYLLNQKMSGKAYGYLETVISYLDASGEQEEKICIFAKLFIQEFRNERHRVVFAG